MDKSFVLEAIKESGGFALNYASRELKADKGFVLEAIKAVRNSYSKQVVLECLSPELRADKDVVGEAMKKSGTWRWPCALCAKRRRLSVVQSSFLS